MSRKRFTGVVAVTVAALMILGGTAIADNLDNQLDLSLDANLETVNLAPGGATQNVTLKLHPINGDGDQACNIDGTESLVLAITSSNTGVATVPATVTFNQCNERTITVTSVAAGTSNVTFSISSNNTGAGTFSLTGGDFSVAVASANTAPAVSVTGFTDGDSFEIGSEPTPGCSVTDTEDGNSNPTPSIDTSALSHGLGTVTVTCSYTDAGGLSDSDQASYTIVDTGDPTIQGAISPTSPDGDNGWYVTFPTVTFTCADVGGSGIQSCLADGELTNSKTLSSDGADQSVGGTATDWANNTAQATVSDIDVDTTDPTNIQFTGVGGPYYFNFVPAASTFGCTADDATSLLASCVVTGYSAAIGTHTLTATATDNAGNDDTATTTYTVLPWTLQGFYSPVDAAPIVNTVKGGSTVPLKFEVFAGLTELTMPSVVDTFKVVRQGCGSSTLPTDDIEQYSTGKTQLRYDQTGGQFIQNWQTPATKNECYTVTLTLDDGSTKSALFKTK